MNWKWDDTKFNEYSYNGNFDRSNYQDVLNNMLSKFLYKLRIRFKEYVKELEYTPYEEIDITNNLNKSLNDRNNC